MPLRCRLLLALVLPPLGALLEVAQLDRGVHRAGEFLSSRRYGDRLVPLLDPSLQLLLCRSTACVEPLQGLLPELRSLPLLLGFRPLARTSRQGRKLLQAWHRQGRQIRAHETELAVREKLIPREPAAAAPKAAAGVAEPRAATGNRLQRRRAGQHLRTRASTETAVCRVLALGGTACRGPEQTALPQWRASETTEAALPRRRVSGSHRRPAAGGKSSAMSRWRRELFQTTAINHVLRSCIARLEILLLSLTDLPRKGFAALRDAGLLEHIHASVPRVRLAEAALLLGGSHDAVHVDRVLDGVQAAATALQSGPRRLRRRRRHRNRLLRRCRRGRGRLRQEGGRKAGRAGVGGGAAVELEGRATMHRRRHGRGRAQGGSESRGVRGEPWGL
mmetsp:Transcript_171194/g.548800  ORF Transcript_171194/g.548800 Transcript_171194/m.548800 type:complete len:391 (-) Transcript_171194:913-2085(-)